MLFGWVSKSKLENNSFGCTLKSIGVIRMRNSWYSEQAGFFGANYLEEFAYIFDPTRIKIEVDFIEKLLGYNHALKILDLACGNGRHSIELARRGYSIIGLDLNSFFLKQAAIAAKEAQVTVKLMHGDMRKIPFKNEIDAITFLFSSFGYFETDQDNYRVLEQVVKALRPGGKFIMDFINHEWIVRNYCAYEQRILPNGVSIDIQRNFELTSGRNYERRTRIFPDGKREEVEMIIRVYTTAELIRMCETAGLQIKEVYGGYNFEPLTIDSKFIVLNAIKPDI